MRKTGDEPLTFDGKNIGPLLRDFWSWHFSDLLDNTLRGFFAEFIVAAALGLDTVVKTETWDAWDLTLSEKKIEVKCSAYLQSWDENHLSKINFTIRPTKPWNDTENKRVAEKYRPSDVYVFCLYAQQDKSQANPLNLNDWKFYVVPTEKINRTCGNQEIISLASLCKKFKIQAKNFSELKDAVIEALNVKKNLS